MGWERGHYYTRSLKVNGRVVREYVGGGQLGKLAAQLDAIERERRQTEAQDRRAVREDLDEAAESLVELNRRCDLLTRAALLATGFRQHKRGEWRKSRVNENATDPAPDAGEGGGQADGAAAGPDR